MGPWGLLILLLLSLSAVSSTSSSYPAVLSISTVTSGQNGFLIEQGTLKVLSLSTLILDH